MTQYLALPPLLGLGGLAVAFVIYHIMTRHNHGDGIVKKIGDQIAYASKKAIPFVLCVGEEELANGMFAVKSLADGKEEKMDTSMIGSWINTR